MLLLQLYAYLTGNVELATRIKIKRAALKALKEHLYFLYAEIKLVERILQESIMIPICIEETVEQYRSAIQYEVSYVLHYKDVLRALLEQETCFENYLTQLKAKSTK